MALWQSYSIINSQTFIQDNLEGHLCWRRLCEFTKVSPWAGKKGEQAKRDMEWWLPVLAWWLPVGFSNFPVVIPNGDFIGDPFISFTLAVLCGNPWGHLMGDFTSIFQRDGTKHCSSLSCITPACFSVLQWGLSDSLQYFMAGTDSCLCVCEFVFAISWNTSC